MGILIAFGVANVFVVAPTPEVVLFGVLFALLPDIDFLLTRIAAIRNVIGEHRSATHFPLLHLVVSMIMYMLFGKVLATLYFICTFYHLVHDTLFLGWGIKWLWPYSNKALSIFHDKGGVITSDILVWGTDEDKRVRTEYASPNWVRDFYLRPSIIAFSEYGIFLAGLAALIYQFRV
jgi:hypothetical protein